MQTSKVSFDRCGYPGQEGEAKVRLACRLICRDPDTQHGNSGYLGLVDPDSTIEKRQQYAITVTETGWREHYWSLSFGLPRLVETVGGAMDTEQASE